MQIYILITVSLICISCFDSNVYVTILYLCPHICLPPPPTQADAEAVRESIRGAFARGTIQSEASAGLLQHRLLARACRIATMPAHAHAAWPTHGSFARFAASPAHAASPARHHFCPPARDLPPLVRTSRRPCAGPAARARTPCHRHIATPGLSDRQVSMTASSHHPPALSLRARARPPASHSASVSPSLSPSLPALTNAPLPHVAGFSARSWTPSLVASPRPAQSPTLPLPQPFHIPVCG